MSKPVVLQPGSHVAVGDQKCASITWNEPVAGTATVRDANGIIGTLTYAGRGKGFPEPAPLRFNPPVQCSQLVVASAPGGWLTVVLQGSSESGH
jgi:hypothetical protein